MLTERVARLDRSTRALGKASFQGEVESGGEGCAAPASPWDARGSESTMTLWLHCSPDGVVVSTSVTPSGAPADMQNAVISPHAPLKAAASTRATAVGFIGLSEDYRAAAPYDRPARPFRPKG